MTWAADNLGPELLTKSGLKPTNEVIGSKKRLGLYFSAHWCPPCRGFTPVLAEFYTTAAEEQDGELEIVFVSSDSDDASFGEYFHSMPWTSVPFSSSNVIQALGSKFGIRGIPAFIVVDAQTGEVKDRDGRSTVASAKGDVNKAIAHWA